MHRQSLAVSRVASGRPSQVRLLRQHAAEFGCVASTPSVQQMHWRNAAAQMLQMLRCTSSLCTIVECSSAVVIDSRDLLRMVSSRSLGQSERQRRPRLVFLVSYRTLGRRFHGACTATPRDLNPGYCDTCLNFNCTVEEESLIIHRRGVSKQSQTKLAPTGPGWSTYHKMIRVEVTRT